MYLTTWFLCLTGLDDEGAGPAGTGGGPAGGGGIEFLFDLLEDEEGPDDGLTWLIILL